MPSTTHQLLILVELDFSSGTSRWHSGVGTVTFNNHEFTGVGVLGRLSNINETIDAQPARVSLELSGVPVELVAIALADQYQGRSAKIWISLYAEHADLVTNAVLVFSGIMDTISGALGDMATLTVQLESRLADFLRPRIRRYTHEDQRLDYPGDRGFEYVPQVVEKEIVWGRAFA